MALKLFVATVVLKADNFMKHEDLRDFIETAIKSERRHHPTDSKVHSVEFVNVTIAKMYPRSNRS
mgnify:CR=1 FL=1